MRRRHMFCPQVVTTKAVIESRAASKQHPEQHMENHTTNTERAARPRGSALTSDRADTATRYLDLEMQQPTEAASEQSIITLESTNGTHEIVLPESIVSVESLVELPTLRETSRR